MHRCCAGVSLSHYASLSVSEEPFFCSICCQQTMRETISSLRDTVSALKLEIAQLKAEKSSLQSGKIALSESSNSVPRPACTAQTHAPGPSTQHSRVDHKFKLVIRGVKEHPKGTQRHVRLEQDEKSTISILSSLHPSITQLSVRDCIRLGKYSESHCRPILATLSRSNDVSTVLTNRHLLSQQHPNISIKPFLTQEARRAEAILLKQRRGLITSGTCPKDIKLRQNTLYVNGRKHGVVVNSAYHLHPLLSDFVCAALSSTTPDPTPPTNRASVAAPIPTQQTNISIQGHPTITSQPINTLVSSPSLPSNTSTVYSQSHPISTSISLTQNTSDTTDPSNQ